MAESALERLRRLAAEKKARESNNASTTNSVDSNVSSNDPSVVSPSGTGEVGTSDVGSQEQGLGESARLGESELLSPDGAVSSTHVAECSAGDSGSSEVLLTSLEPTPSDHPLAMKFAELEQGLLTADPQFKTILRDIHRNLAMEPENVTAMTDEEVALVVRGLIMVAQAEVVEPAKAKAAKKSVAAAKKAVISADDL